ncbi:ATP-binding protein [Archangium primigenium]|uniref:ATP-binding protein n=1 Tax=[Archangium] primigenium TaxID=2792470 RepID=UPI00195A31C4|nr:ATP-binding protein [Archangium primigenium]
MPHIPVRPGATEYVRRPGGASEEIANWILANRSPVLLGGPAGVGKSTELARAAQLLQPHRVACLIPLDRWENMRRLGPEQMLQRIAGRVAYVAKETLHLSLSEGLFEESQKSVSSRWSPAGLARLVLVEVARLSRQGRVTLLLDGLEKVPEGPASMELFDALAALPEEVELVAVIPWHAAFGPHAETIIRAGERFVSARAVEVDGERGREGRAFLQNVLLRRLQLPEEVLDPGDAETFVSLGLPWDEERARAAARGSLVADAAMASGGIPRIFLQLMADAASYAKLRREGDWPIVEDLKDACTDQIDTFRRLLLPGDTDEARNAVGTDGRELELSRKIRLMAHGILLERVREQVPVLELHPLAHIAIERGGSRA